MTAGPQRALASSTGQPGTVVTHKTAPGARTTAGEITLTGMAPTRLGELPSSSPSDAVRNTTSPQIASLRSHASPAPRLHGRSRTICSASL